MRLTINLSDHHKSGLKLPISVSRILKQSVEIIETISVDSDKLKSSEFNERLEYNLRELDEIIPLLDALFMAAKEAMLVDEAQNKFVEENNKIQQDYVRLLKKASGVNNDPQ